MSRLLIFCSALLLLCGCIEGIEFESEGKDFLVVEGFISTESRTHTVRLSRSTAYAGVYSDPVNDANVYITDDLDNSVSLQANGNGDYTTDSDFSAILGRTYTLHIKTAEGREYISEPQTLKKLGSLDKVYFKTERKEFFNDNNNVTPMVGYQYYIDYSFAAEEPTYFLWSWDATYRLRTRYHQRDLPLDCYINENGIGFTNTMSSATVAHQQVMGEKFRFAVPDYKFWYVYSLNVKQYTVSRDVYDFFHSIQKQQENTGSIFDPTPARITGNIKSTTDPDEVVIGFFGAFGMEDRRNFVDSTDLPYDLTDDVLRLGMYDFCEVIPNYEYPDFCEDCRLHPRSTDQVPPYWR